MLFLSLFIAFYTLYFIFFYLYFVTHFLYYKLKNFLTKALPPPTFNTFICKLGMINIYHAPACGRLLKDNMKEIETRLLNEEEVETSKVSITWSISY